MILIRREKDRGLTKTDWLQSYHAFSFADYYDPQFLGFGNLLVINEDTVEAGTGFGAHSHRNMEIITYVISGEIAHQDSMGQSSTLKPGEIQRMSAGRGVKHSEFNASTINKLHFLQIWILPREENTTPSYEQKQILKTKNDLTLIGSSDGESGSVIINQDVNLFVCDLEKENSIAYNFEEKNYGWLQLISGSISVNDEVMNAGDGVAIFDEEKILITGLNDSEFLLFDFKNKNNIKLYE